MRKYLVVLIGLLAIFDTAAYSGELLIYQHEHLNAWNPMPWTSYEVYNPVGVPDYELKFELQRDFITSVPLAQDTENSISTEIQIVVEDPNGNVVLDKIYNLQTTQWYTFYEPMAPQIGGTHRIRIIVPNNFYHAVSCKLYVVH